MCLWDFLTELPSHFISQFYLKKNQDSEEPIASEYKSSAYEVLVVNCFAAAPSSSVCNLPGLRVTRRFPIGNKRRTHGCITDETSAPTHPPRPADGAIQQRQQHTGTTAHQQRLLERVVPERQADRESEHQPDQAQHDAVGFAVMVEGTRGGRACTLTPCIRTGKKPG